MKKLLLIALLIVGVFGQDKDSSEIKFDPITGEIIKPDSTSMRFNPITGESIKSDSTSMRFDPIAGKSIISSKILEKDSLYRYNKKDPVVAGIFSFFLNFSGAGHLYASGGDGKVWLRSLPYSAAMLFFLLKASSNTAEEDSEEDSNEFSPAAFLYGASYMGLVYDSVYMTKKYNIKLHNQIYNDQIYTISELKQFEHNLHIRKVSKSQ